MPRLFACMRCRPRLPSGRHPIRAGAMSPWATVALEREPGARTASAFEKCAGAVSVRRCVSARLGAQFWGSSVKHDQRGGIGQTGGRLGVGGTSVPPAPFHAPVRLHGVKWCRRHRSSSESELWGAEPGQISDGPFRAYVPDPAPEGRQGSWTYPDLPCVPLVGGVGFGASFGSTRGSAPESPGCGPECPEWGRPRFAFGAQR